MEYILCQFEYGYEGMFYQVIQDGVVIRLADIDGNTIIIKEAGEEGYIPCGSVVIDNNPTIPSWAI